MLVVKISLQATTGLSQNKSFGYAGKRDKFHQASSLELRKDMKREKQTESRSNNSKQQQRQTTTIQIKIDKVRK